MRSLPHYPECLQYENCTYLKEMKYYHICILGKFALEITRITP